MPETIESIAQKRRKWVEVNQENGFEAGLKRLLTDLYPDNAHFIFELLQNAEDARAQEVRFILHEDRVEFEHDGDRLFSIANVDAITSIGFSSKRDDATNIGKFGVGFKAVFAYTETPEVESGKFHFRILDMVVPESNALSGSRSRDKQTRFILPFDNPKKEPDQARKEIERLLKALDVTTLLFLSHIRKIEYLLPDSSLGYIERIGIGNNRFEIRVQQPNHNFPSSTWFMKFDKEVQVEDGEAEIESQKVKSCRIAIVFGLRPIEAKVGVKEEKGGDGNTIPELELMPMDPGRVCIYFPADKETSNLRFHLHAPFASTVARDSVRDCPENNVLRDHLADLLAESMSTIRDQGLLTVRALALLPNDKDNLSKFFKPIMDRLVAEFREENLVPMKRGGHAAADRIFRGTKVLSDLIDDEDIVVLLGEEYVAPIWASNPSQRNQREDNFLSMLGIEQWDVAELVKALSEVNNDALGRWMGSKDEKWHQNFYEILMDYINAAPKYPSTAAAERILTIKTLSIVWCSDGIYRKGSDCYFPTEVVEFDDKFPRVAKGGYFAGKDENKKAREFLATVGVHAVDEKAEIEYILKGRYSQEAVNKQQFRPELSDLARFIEFSEKNPNDIKLFQGHYIFKLENGKWGTPQSVYIDAPFMDTGLREWFEAQEDTKQSALSREYETCGVKPEQIGEFAKNLGVIIMMRIEKTSVSTGHPEWSELRRLGGKRFTGYGRDEDYHIPGLAEFLTSPSVSRARLVWRTMKESCADYSCQYLKADYGRNASNIASGKSTLVHDLLQAEWVPQDHPNQTEFVRPRDAVAEMLPKDFEFQTGWQWLKTLEFGEGVKERREARRKEKERQSQEYKQKEQVLKEVGFDSPEEAEEMARLKREDPQGFQRWRESRQAKPAFPDRASADPERRKSKAMEKAAGAPNKLYKKRERSVRTSRTQGKTETDEYLRDLYTNNDDQLICQICREEMPFRKKNGRHYFEKVEAFDLRDEYSANHLALCPVCAAKYDEFVFHGPNEARDKLLDTFAQMGDTLELPVTLGEEFATIRFVQSHAIDLRVAISEK